MHIITIVVQLIEGFVMTSETPGGSTRYFLDMGTSVHVAQESAYTFNVRFSSISFFFIKQDSRIPLKESDWGRNSRLACIYCLEKGSSCYRLTGEQYASKFTSC